MHRNSVHLNHNKERKLLFCLHKTIFLRRLILKHIFKNQEKKES